MRKLLIIFVITSQFIFAQDAILKESYKFLGGEKCYMGLGALSAFTYKTDNNFAAFTKFPILADYDFNNYNRIRVFMNSGFYQSDLSKPSTIAGLFDIGLEYAYFLIRDKTNNIGFKLRQNFVKISSNDNYNNITSLQFLYEDKIGDFDKNKNVGSLRIFAAIGGYYLYNSKIGGLSLLAGISIGNGIRISFDFGSLIYKNYDLNRFLSATTNDY